MFKTSFTSRLAALAISFAAFSVPLYADDGAQSTDQKQEETKKVEPVDFRKLKELLPESVGGVKRSEAKGEKAGFGDQKISQANGEYSADNNEASATVSIIDYGGIPGAAAGFAAWTQMDIDNESDDEYTKTVTVAGIKALETYNTKEKHGSIQFLVASRFIVNIELHSIAAEELQKTMNEMKLKDLEALAK